MRSSSTVYIPRIDHLRAFAMILVFVWHATHMGTAIPAATVPSFFVLSIFEEGHTGVSLFLTLSGFIFASLVEGQTISYGSFIRNRILRIAPLFWLWTFLLYYAQSTIPPERLLANLFANRGDFPGPAWTVLIEFQLYLVFPFLVRFRRNYGPKYLVGLVAVLIFLRGHIWLVTHTIQYVSYWTVIGRADEFLLGMLAFDASLRWGKQIGRPWVFFVVCTVWLVIMHAFNRLGGYYNSAGTPFGNGLWVTFPTVEGFFYGFIIVSYLNLPLRGSKTLSRFFAFVGSISYSAYLAHFTVAQACYNLASRAGIPVETPVGLLAVIAFFAFPSLLACSALTYYVVEVPFLTMRRRYVLLVADKHEAAAAQ
jgi:peptidoglycan/LPS O-acetylase OafA/YrhL